MAQAQQYHQMELAYLSKLAWEGLRHGHASLDKELQKSVLKQISQRYILDSANQTSHWRHIQALGLLQNARGNAPEHLTYFPHLTWQEWFAARHLAQVLIAGEEDPDYPIACQLLAEEKYTPRYQVMLPFCAGLLYQHALTAADRSQPLETFWNYLHTDRTLAGCSHTLLALRCLNACHGDTTAPQLSRQVIHHHQTTLKELVGWLTCYVDCWDDATQEMIDRHLIEGLRHLDRLLTHPTVVEGLRPTLTTWSKKKKRSQLQVSKLKSLTALPWSEAISDFLVEACLHAAKDSYSSVRDSALQALSATAASCSPTQLDKHLDDIIDACLHAAKDSSSSVRQSARQALNAIDWRACVLERLQKYDPAMSSKSGAFAAMTKGLLVVMPKIVLTQTELASLPDGAYGSLCATLKEVAKSQSMPTIAYDVKACRLPAKATTSPKPILVQKSGKTALHEILEREELDEARIVAICTAVVGRFGKKCLNNQGNEAGEAPIHIATRQKQWEVVRWLVEQGAWIDIADRKGFSPIYILLTSPELSTQPRVQELLPLLLKRRQGVSVALIEAAVTQAAHSDYDPATETTLDMADEAFQEQIDGVVARLVGKSCIELQEMINSYREAYRGASRNVQEEKVERRGVIDFTQGLSIEDFLPIRIWLFFELLVKLERGEYGRFPQALLDQYHDTAHTTKALKKRGMAELQSQLNTLWDRSIMLAVKFEEPAYHQAWVDGVLKRLSSSKEETLSLGASDGGHAIYITLTKSKLSSSDRSPYYIIRIDNRFKPSFAKNHPLKPFTRKKGEETIGDELVQPYLLASFPATAWKRQQAWLSRYLLGILTHEGGIMGYGEARKHYYQKGTREVPQAERVTTWATTAYPWRPTQLSAENCYLRSHNVGCRISLGDTIYSWMKKKCLFSTLFIREFPDVSTHMPSTAPARGGSAATRRTALKKKKREKPKKDGRSSRSAVLPAVTTTPPPSHQTLMERFQEVLGTSWEAVYSGADAEQALVRYAGLGVKQIDPHFHRIKGSGLTRFTLDLDRLEAKQFLSHYEAYHSGLIGAHSLPTAGRALFDFDTKCLYEEVLPKLKKKK